MDKKIKKAYKFFKLEYDATEQDVERSALDKTQKIQKKYAKNTPKMECKLLELKEYKNLIINNLKAGVTYNVKRKECRYNVSLNSIYTLVGVLVFALIVCCMSFYLIF